jgi:6-phosphogluconolactonase
VRIYIGTYTKTTSKGIYVLQMDPASGRLSEPQLAVESASPSFLAMHQGGRFLFAVNETADFDGTKCGAVSAFAIDPPSGKLTLLNQRTSGGPSACYVSIDSAGRWVLVANYSGGNLSVLPIGADGRLGVASAFVQHAGPTGDPAQKPRPHAHCIDLDAANRFAFVCDLGLDKVFVYHFNAAAGKLLPNDPPAVAVAPKAGPRHLAFVPMGQFAYVINELGSTITAFRYDASAGRLAETQTIPTLPPDFKAENATAEIAVHPSGRFLYGSNRGHDSIAMFAIDAKTGKLSLLGWQPTLGKEPRHFALDPTGKWMIVANQNSDSLVVFRIDEQTGRLVPTDQKVMVPSPVCVTFAGR